MDFHRMDGADYPLAKSIFAAANLMGSTREQPIRIRLIIDTAAGSGRLYRPGESGLYSVIDFGSPVDEGMYIGFRTNSLSVVFDNVSISIID